MHKLSLLAVPLVATVVCAQGGVIPDGFATTEANYRQWAFSKYGPSRCQILYDASLVAKAPRIATKLSFRKDGAYVSTSYPKGPAHDFWQTVSIATKGVPDADHSSWLFSENRGTDFALYMKKTKINWPQILNDGKTQPAAFVTTMPLDRPAVLPGGNLLIQIDTDTATHKYLYYLQWYIDAQNMSPTAGTTGSIAFPSGKIGCNGTNGRYPSFYVSPASYSARPGAKMRLYMWRISLKATAAAGFIGTQLAASIDLSGLGMTGCKLHILPLILVPLSLGNPNLAGSSPYMRAYGHVALPNDKALEGVVFALQALVADPGANTANLILSNTSTCKLGTAVPPGGLRHVMMLYSYGSDVNDKVLTWNHARYYAPYAPVIKLN